MPGRSLPSRLPAPPGWFWPAAEDPALPYPNILLPKSTLPWEQAVNRNNRYGIGSHPEWVSDEHAATFPQMKEDLRSFADHFGSHFNSTRERAGLAPTTVESEAYPRSHDELWLHSFERG